MNKNKPTRILLVEDDPDDCVLITDALAETENGCEVWTVKDGQELLDYLAHVGEFSLENAPRPHIILLDLNLPKKDGREVLKEIKANPQFCDIPILVLTTSNSNEEILRAYQLGANAYFTKPASYAQLVDLMRTLKQYWFEFAELPDV